MIPKIDMADLMVARPDAQAALRRALSETGFLTLTNTAIAPARVLAVIEAYRAFFRLPESEKQTVDMARTHANRGWGAPGSEQVDPDANPDYKQVFDCGFELPQGDPMASLAVYGPNVWPADRPDFRATVEAYARDARVVAMDLLRIIAQVLGRAPGYFDDKFDRPMALLRGNYYPPRPHWAGERDFGIAAHTDYGCLTLLATDGVAGLEVMGRDGGWMPVTVAPGDFVINFGEMLEMWTEGTVRATLHRVRGSGQERISVPLFFNPNYDANVAPPGAEAVILAGEHLSRRFAETYVHLQKAKG